MLERPGLREETGQVRGGEEDPFPILVTLCAKRGLVRNSRKNNKSIILHLERRTKRPEHLNEARIPWPGHSQYNCGPRSVRERSTVLAWERSNWRGQSPGSRVRIGVRVLDSSWIHRWWAMMAART